MLARGVSRRRKVQIPNFRLLEPNGACSPTQSFPEPWVDRGSGDENEQFVGFENSLHIRIFSIIEGSNSTRACARCGSISIETFRNDFSNCAHYGHGLGFKRFRVWFLSYAHQVITNLSWTGWAYSFLNLFKFSRKTGSPLAIASSSCSLGGGSVMSNVTQG